MGRLEGPVGERGRTRLPTPDPLDASTWSPVPSWMLVPSAPPNMSPPVETRPQLLPVDRLSWEDFERLCLRLLEQDVEPVHVSGSPAVVEATKPVVRQYGLRGQNQAGIDVYARDRVVPGEAPRPRHFVCLQARRTKRVTAAVLRSSADKFLEGKWSSVSRKFIYATTASVASTALADEIEKQASRLIEQSVEFVIWDQAEISTRLKDQPSLVDDFFGREWVREFCAEAAAQKLGTRLDAWDVANLRQELANIYNAAFGVADSGQIALRWSETPSVGLLDRFVTPDLILSTPEAASRPQTIDSPDGAGMDDNAQELLSEAAASQAIAPDENAWFLRSSGRRQRLVESPVVFERIPADQWIGTQFRQVIVGEPGAGKSTLLRHLVLDLLSEKPRWRTIAARWGRHLPVWLPFHFFTQRVAGQTGGPASVGETLRAWLEQHDSGHIWPLVEAALNDERLLLVVDGLDEWISDEAGRHAVAALRTFADSRSAPLVVSSRPYGLGMLTLGTGWAHARIAPLTSEQQQLLASHYFHARVDADDGSRSAAVIDRSVASFLSQVRGVPDLHALSRIPLFLVLLVGLRLSSDATLPASRFEVHDRAVRLLVADHRAQRRTAAAVTTQRQGLTDDQLRTVLAKVAFLSQDRGNLAALPEVVLRTDFVDALRDPDGLAMDPAQAAATADQLVTVAEGELGLLVRQGPKNLAFLHRTLQDQLAAEYIADRCSPTEAIQIFKERVGDSRWSEVLLATMWRLRRPAELRDLVAAVSARVDGTLAGLRARELLAELIFGPYSLPANEIQRSVPEIIEAVETHPYGPHRTRLLDIVLNGLDGATTGDIVSECLERWTLLTQEPSSELVREISRIPPAQGLSDTICTLLVRGLHYPDSSIAYASGLAIASRCSGDGIGSEAERELMRESLLQVVSNPPSALAAAVALLALTLEWRDDPLVAAILKDARSHAEESVRIIALSDTLGVLKLVFSAKDAIPTPTVHAFSDAEREWLFGRLSSRTSADSHWGVARHYGLSGSTRSDFSS